MPTLTPVHKAHRFARLPPPWPHADACRDEIAALLAKGERKIVVLDDDPTGSQTVHGIDVVIKPSVDAFESQFRSVSPLFYVLTNSRSLEGEEARRLNLDLLEMLDEAAGRARSDYTLISRSDSTLRGHFPAETAAINDHYRTKRGLDINGIALAPAFIEGGRYTIDDVHWVEEQERLIPAGQTQFAQDPAFGFASSNLIDWIAEKDPYSKPAISLPLDVIRKEGPDSVCRAILDAPPDTTMIVNAADYSDILVIAAAFHRAEAQGKRYIYRTAASFVSCFGGLKPRSHLLGRDVVAARKNGRPSIGLTIVGSHVSKSTRQLNQLIKDTRALAIELPVTDLVSAAHREQAIASAVEGIEGGIESNRSVILFTSRGTLGAGDPSAYLEFGRRISDSLVEIVARLHCRPDFVIAKGGITSSEIASRGLHGSTARVLGQLMAGVSVWKLDEKSKWPTTPFVVFPGNVGQDDSLLAAFNSLAGAASTVL